MLHLEKTRKIRKTKTQSKLETDEKTIKRHENTRRKNIFKPQRKPENSSPCSLVSACDTCRYGIPLPPALCMLLAWYLNICNTWTNPTNLFWSGGSYMNDYTSTCLRAFVISLKVCFHCALYGGLHEHVRQRHFENDVLPWLVGGSRREKQILSSEAKHTILRHWAFQLSA